jgi:hypothetical protein
MNKNIFYGMLILLAGIMFAFSFTACGDPEDPTATPDNREPGAAVESPTLDSKTHNSITVNAVEAPDNGQTVEYAKNTENAAPASGWQDETTFSGLNPSTTYYIFARSKENAAYKPGAASGGLSVTTDPAPPPDPVYAGFIGLEVDLEISGIKDDKGETPDDMTFRFLKSISHPLSDYFSDYDVHISGGTLTLELGTPKTEVLEPLPSGAGLTVSDDTAKSFTIMDGFLVAAQSYELGYSGATIYQSVRLMYVTKNVIINGSLTEDSFTETWDNVELKTGWNYVISILDEDVTTGTLSAEEPDESFKWVVNNPPSYDGQIYNMDLLEREPVTNIPTGTVLAKSDYGWDDDHDEDIDDEWWLEAGSVTGNKITIELPETVDDSFLRDGAHSKFGAKFKLGVAGPGKRFSLVKNFVYVPVLDIDWPTEEINVLYLKTAQPNYVVDDDELTLTLALDQGWNFFIRADDAVEKIDSLEEAYQRGFRWYLHDEAKED